MESETLSFLPLDYVVFGIMLCCSAGIGIYYTFTGGKQRTTREYLLADGSMGVIPVSFSLMASFMSAVTLLGVSAENYMYGTQFVVVNFSYVIGTPIAAFIFLPVFFRNHHASSFEYLEYRFDKKTRLVASAVFMTQLVLYMSIVLYAPALALSTVTGLPKWLSVISVGIVCTFYCTLGGMKAVLWTDVFQSLLMFSAVFVVIVKGTYDIGTISDVWNIAKNGGRIQFSNFDPDPTVRHSVWSLAIGGIFMYVSIYGINQAQVQRLLTTKNLRHSQIALFISLPITSLLSVTTCLAGIVVYANFANCDPLMRSKYTHVESADQILPYFVMKSFQAMPGLPGVFVAGIFSGALSTMSSAINSLAAVTFEDFLRHRYFKDASDMKMVTTTKIIAFVYGILCIALTYVVDKLGGVLQASLTIFNVVGGPLLGLFSLGMLFARSKTNTSLAGFITGLSICLWIGLGSLYSGNKPQSLPRSTLGCLVNESFPIDAVYSTVSSYVNRSEALKSNESSGVMQNLTVSSMPDVFPLYKLSYMWYACLGFLITVTIGIIGSFIEGSKFQSTTDPHLLSPLVASYPEKDHKSNDYRDCATADEELYRKEELYPNKESDLTTNSITTKL